MKKKRIIILIVILIVVAIGAFFAISYFTRENEPIEENNNNNVEEKEKEIEEDDYLTLYKEYLQDELFPLDIEEVTGVLLNAEEKEEPILVIKYMDQNSIYQIIVLSIQGDEVLASETYRSVSLNYLYNVEEDKVQYFINEIDSHPNYISISDILQNKTDIEEISEDDLDKDYVLIDQAINFYNIEEDKLDSSLERLVEKDEDTDTTTLDSAVDEIKGNVLRKDENGIYNDTYRIAYGIYVYGDTEITISSDNSVYEKGWMDWYGSYDLQYNKIVTLLAGDIQTTDIIFVIEDNNKLRAVNENNYLEDTIWNLK